MGLFYFGLCSIWFINRTTSTPDQGRLFINRFKKSNIIQDDQDSYDNQDNIEINQD